MFGVSKKLDSIFGVQEEIVAWILSHLKLGVPYPPPPGTGSASIDSSSTAALLHRHLAITATKDKRMMMIPGNAALLHIAE